MKKVNLRKIMKSAKTICIMLCAMVILMTMNSCVVQESFTIEAEIAGLPDGTVMALVPKTNKEEKPVAEAVASGGKFKFAYAVESPRIFFIELKNGVGGFSVLVENGDRLKVSATMEYIRKTPAPMLAMFNNVQISGSAVYTEYRAKTAYREELKKMEGEIAERHKVIWGKLSEAYKAQNMRLADSIRKTDAYSAAEQDNIKLSEKKWEGVKKVILENRDSWWGPFLMFVSIPRLNDNHKELFAAFSDKAKQSYYGKLVESILYPAASVGKPAPAFTVKDADGNVLTLAQLIAGKKYVLIDFWASWCGPCRKEIPNLKAAYETFAPRGLEIISISTDRDPAAWQKALSEEQIPWLNFRDDSGIADAYSVQAIPAIFLLDADGTILATKLRGEALQQKLAELLP